MKNDNNTEVAVEIHDLSVSYHKKPVLWSVDFQLPKGKISGIIGPNGAGKSTLMKAIMGLIKPSSGKVIIYGQSLEKIRHLVAYVPQKESVDWDFPASVYDVVMMGRYKKLGLFKRPKSADKDYVMHCLEKVKLAQYKDRQISKLSGGQQQRVFLARALAQEADIYFMDEPFAGVDAASETNIIKLFQSMVKEGKSIVAIHHDLQSAQHFFDWIVLLNMRKIADGKIEDTMTAENLKKTYGGQLNILTEVSKLIQVKNLPQRVE